MNSEELTEQVAMKYGTVERERRFLIQALPSDLNLQDYRRIDDRYLPNTFLRLRQITTPEGDVIQQKCEATTQIDCAEAFIRLAESHL